MAADFISLADYLHRRHPRTNASPASDNVIPLPARTAAEHAAEADAAGIARPANDVAPGGSDASCAGIHEGQAVPSPADLPACASRAIPPAAGALVAAVTREETVVTSDDVRDALRDARLFRARLSDALDYAAARLVRELAAEVLARELRLAPCEIVALVARVRERAPVMRVRVSLEDAARVYGVPAVADAELISGDAIVELAGSAIDARLGVRLAGVLEAFA